MGLVANRVKRQGNESKNPSMMTTFNFYFLFTLVEQLLRQTDNPAHLLKVTHLPRMSQGLTEKSD